MFYAEQKNYPYGIVTNADNNTMTTSEEFNEKALLFKTIKQATKYFKSLGWFYSVNIINMEEALLQ